MSINYYCLFFTILFSFSSFAQDFSKEVLQEMEDKELLILFTEVQNDSIKAEKVAGVYLARAKKEKDTLKIANGYDKLARIFNYKKNLQYADSLISLTKNLNSQLYPGTGYLLKARIHNSNGDIKETTENYLIAYELSVKNNNLSHQVFTLGRLIFLKSIWGDKREALRLQKKRHSIIKSKVYTDKIYNTSKDGNNEIETVAVDKDELNSIFIFSFCYLNLRKLDSATIYVNKGLQKSKTYKGLDQEIVIDYFNELLIEINYYKKNYGQVISNTDKLLLKLDFSDNKETFQNLYFFKGMSYIKTDKYKNGISLLKKSDSIFETENLQIKQPYQRELFEILLEHYIFENNPKQQIKYLNKLILADSVIIKKYQYFEPNLIKKFETPKLIKEKERLIASLTKKNETKSVAIWWSLGLLSISLIVIGFYINRQIVFKKRFDTLILKNEENNKNNKEKPTKNELSKEIINEILEHLETFENTKAYLSQDVSIQTMSKSFGTNHKYLSNVINLQKGKRFSNYINDLRVEYAYSELKLNSKFRKYTIKAISKDCGFKSAESFSKSFYKIFGIYPSYYIKQLNKNFEANS